MAKNEVADIMKSADVSPEQDDLKARSEQCHDEIKKILAKYNLDIGAKLNFSETSIVPTPMFIDKKEA